MVVTPPCDGWLVLADHYHACLLSLRATPTGRCELVEYGSIESPIPDVAFCRPSMGTRMSEHHYKANAQRLDEEYRRFARQLARWIGLSMQRFGIDRLTAFIPERSHREVLAHLCPALRERVDLRCDNLLRLSPEALRNHPAIVGLAGSEATGIRRGLVSKSLIAGHADA